jgi:hypothetical protein
MVQIYPAPSGEELSAKFSVFVGDSSVPVYKAKVASWKPSRWADTNWCVDEAAFASFDTDGQVTVRVTCPMLVKTAKVLPASAGIVPMIKGNTITIAVCKPGQLTLEINDDWMRSLHLFINPPETDAPRPNDPNVIYFGPGIHEVDNMTIASGKTVYIAGGAVVRGKGNPYDLQGSIFSLLGSNIVFRGRGIIDGSLCRVESTYMISVKGTNILLEDVILRDSSHWTVPIRSSERVTVKNLKLIGYRGSSDGIDICGSRQVTVSDCFIRTMDDLVVVKTKFIGDGGSRDITVKGCVLWNELAHALSVGAELRENVANVRFSNCDVVHDKGREWTMRIYHCDGAKVSRIIFENIRVEETESLISLWIGKRNWSKDQDRGHIDDVTFQNIQAAGKEARIDLKGFDDEHAIHNVHFDQVLINGVPLNSTKVLQNRFVKEVAITL